MKWRKLFQVEGTSTSLAQCASYRPAIRAGTRTASSRLRGYVGKAERLAGTLALIFLGPSDTLFSATLTALLQEYPTPFALETGPAFSYPGLKKLLPLRIARPGTAPPYTGKLLLLVNEQNQSQAELLTMALRATPHAQVVGSTTAGTDGNAVALVLPENAHTQITTIGEYYPDGRETQRIGIVPDVEVRPAIARIRAGYDEVLQKARQLAGSTR